MAIITFTQLNHINLPGLVALVIPIIATMIPEIISFVLALPIGYLQIYGDAINHNPAIKLIQLAVDAWLTRS